MEAATVVSVSMGVMKPVLAKLVTLMGNEYNNKLKGLHREVTFLRRELSDMDALLEKMDSADELDPQAKKWRKDIIEMSYDIEHRIDDFMHSVGDTNDKMGILQKASHCVRTFKDRRRLANEFQEIKTLVTEASDRRKRYMLDQCISVTTPVVVDPRMLVLYKESTSLVGIKAQKDELVNWAMDEVKQLKLMAIVGCGGLGKTTLANEVYRDVGEKFECKAFIYISQKPQMIGIFNSLLTQFDLQTCSHACQLQDPINRLRGHLRDKRYFIVVDDLWDMQAWDAIECAFPKSNHCSRVTVTTRNENVARSCCNNHHRCIHNMKHLSEQDSSKLFFGRIFGSEDACPTELKKASCGILKKCGGLPLAIITMASMLACQPRRLEGQWEYIQNSLDIKSATNSKYEDMMYILGLSYKNLPRHLKACFLYLGSYPEDHVIQRAELVRRWVAEGFVSNSAGQDVWDVAESYFSELVNRSMIQPIYNDYNVVSCCRVHDMLLDLIVRRCKEDNLLHLINDPEAVVEVQDEVIRRLTVVGLGDTEEDMKVTRTNSWNLSQIRSLTILGESNWTPPLLEFKLLQMLFIGLSARATRLDLRGIVQLSQLKYLKVECNRWITGEPHHSIVLPSQIGMLQHLETLELPVKSSCRIPKDVVHLSRLSHLILPLGTRLSDGIGRLKSLRTLDGFSPAKSSLQNTKDLSELTNLADLKLIVSREVYWNTMLACADKDDTPEATWMAALTASMGKLGKLKRLSMESFYESSNGDALSSFSPPFHNLEHLNLSGWFVFSRVPKWVGVLRNLHSLELVVKEVMSESTCMEDVGIIGMLPSLVRLELQIPGIPRERIVIGSTGFAILKHLWFDCDAISYLTFEAGAMPKLKELVLGVDSHGWDKATPVGLEHLPSLMQIQVWWMKYYDTSAIAETEERKISEQLIQRLFQLAVDALPSRPTFILNKGCACRSRGSYSSPAGCFNVLFSNS